LSATCTLAGMDGKKLTVTTDGFEGEVIDAVITSKDFNLGELALAK
jgi:hypothetical protein